MGKKVLLADKSATIHKLVEMHLTDSGYQLKTVSTGKEAVAAIPEFQPDLILVDAFLELTNYEVCTHIKSLGTATPVVLLIGRFQPFSDDDAAASNSAGITKILKKPFAQDQLISVISELAPDTGGDEPAADPAPDLQSEDIAAPPVGSYDDGATVQFSPEMLQASIGSVDVDDSVPSMDDFSMDDDDDLEELDDDDVEELDDSDFEDLHEEDVTMDLGAQHLVDEGELPIGEADDSPVDVMEETADTGWPESDAPTLEVDREMLEDAVAEVDAAANTNDLPDSEEQDMQDTGDLEEEDEDDGSFADIGDFGSSELDEDDLGSDGFAEDFGTDVGFGDDSAEASEPTAEAVDSFGDVEDALDTEPMDDVSVDEVDFDGDLEEEFDDADLEVDDDTDFEVGDLDDDLDADLDGVDSAGLETDPDLGHFGTQALEDDSADEAQEALVVDDESDLDDLDTGLADTDAEQIDLGEEDDELEVDDSDLDTDEGFGSDLDSDDTDGFEISGDAGDEDFASDDAFEVDDVSADSDDLEPGDFDLDTSSGEELDQIDHTSTDSDALSDDVAIGLDDDQIEVDDSFDTDLDADVDSEERLDGGLPAADEIHSLELDAFDDGDGQDDPAEDSYSDMGDFGADSDAFEESEESDDRVPMDFVADSLDQDADELAADNQDEMDATVDLSSSGAPMMLPDQVTPEMEEPAETVALNDPFSPGDLEIEDPAAADGAVLTDLDEVRAETAAEAETLGSYEVEEIEPPLIGGEPEDTMDEVPGGGPAGFPDEDQVLDAQEVPASEMPTEELDAVLDDEDDDLDLGNSEDDAILDDPDELDDSDESVLDDVDDVDEASPLETDLGDDSHDSVIEEDGDDSLAEPAEELELDSAPELDLDPEPALNPEPVHVDDEPGEEPVLDIEPEAAPEPEPEPEPEAAPEPPVAAPAPAAPVSFAGDANLTDAQLDSLADRVAEKVAAQLVEKLGEDGIRDIVWQVVPELAEAMIKKRVFQLEQAVDEE